MQEHWRPLLFAIRYTVNNYGASATVVVGLGHGIGIPFTQIWLTNSRANTRIDILSAIRHRVRGTSSCVADDVKPRSSVRSNERDVRN